MAGEEALRVDIGRGIISQWILNWSLTNLNKPFRLGQADQTEQQSDYAQRLAYQKH